MPANRIVSLRDGRSLNVYDVGDSSGAAILYHHGTPASGLPYEAHLHAARDQGLRLISYDRAGYAGSSRSPGRAVVDIAADVLAVADALGIDRFATWGASGGGPHALACAARGGGRVVAAASMAGVGPTDAPDLDWLAGMGEGNIAEFAIAQEGETALRPAHETTAAELLELELPGFVAAMRPFLSDVDAAVLDGDFGAHMLAVFQHALSEGVDGWVDDDLALMAPWGFDLAEIDVPVLVLQGRQDLMVPYGHAEWLVRHLPTSEPRLNETDGHLTLLANETPHLLAWLAAHH
jgi:pimeloyl-ACP methyl ester carboxylesterase